jgi:hypothetical protein
MYQRIQKRLENSNLAIGEFPDVVAKNIRKAIIEGSDNDATGLKELLEIRNSKQVAALEELWSQLGHTTESEFFREKLISICLNAGKEVESEYGGLIKVIETTDGEIYRLSSQCGMAESISLKSKIWNKLKYYDDSVEVIFDKNERPAFFKFTSRGLPVALKHTSIAKLILKEELGDKDFLSTYPKMLPNSKHLDLSYSVEGKINPAPNYWVE